VLRRVVKCLSVLLLVGVVLPQAVEAATASFSSTSGSVPAAYGNNTATSGFAWGLKGQSASPQGRGIEGYASSTATGANAFHVGLMGTAKGAGYGTLFGQTQYTSGLFGLALGTGADNEVTNGVFGRSDSTEGNGVFGRADNTFGTGVFGSSNGSSGVGVWGSGLFGTVGGGAIGVDGYTDGIGTGNYAVWSEHDLGVTGHLVTGGSNVTGTCNILATAATATCAFQTAWNGNGNQPNVIVTALGDPGGYYWVSSVNKTADANGDAVNDWVSFTVQRSGTLTNPANFAFFVIGTDDNLACDAFNASGCDLQHAQRFPNRAARHAPQD